MFWFISSSKCLCAFVVKWQNSMHDLTDVLALSCRREMVPVITSVYFSTCQESFNRGKTQQRQLGSTKNYMSELWKRIEIHVNLYWPREQHGNPLFKISCSSFCPPSLLASPIKALMLFTLSFLWPPSSASALRLSSPSVSNSSSFIETNRLEVTPGRADDDSWLLRSTQSEGFSFASKTRWYSFVAMAPNFLLA